MLSAQSWLALRAVAAIVERRGQITHVFGGQVSWHLLRALGRRPLLLTAVVTGTPGGIPPGTTFARVVVETEVSIDEWLTAGVSRERIEVVRPGIDLDWFRPVPLTAGGRFTLLFASTPSDPAEISSRGIPLLLDLARLRPDIDVVVPWRLWGDLARAKRVLAELRPPPNFILTFDDRVDMRAMYARAHATVASFEAGVGKTCPNFVLEGFASGRPCLSTADGNFTPLLREMGAGVIAARDVASLAAAADRLRDGWDGYARNARRTAEQYFGMTQFRLRYEQIYAEIAGEAATALDVRA